MATLADALTPQGGDYVLSSYGEILSYRQTTVRLLSHYLQNGLKVPPAEVQKKARGLNQLLETKFNTPEDYAEKIPELAEFIGEKNTARLGAFLGQHFFTTLEKTKTALKEKALPLAKDVHENPYRVPGNDLLLLYGEQFTKAQPLSEPKSNLVVDLSASSADNSQTATSPATPGSGSSSTQILSGEKLLEQYGNDFSSAPPLPGKPAAGAPLPDLSADPSGSTPSVSTPASSGTTPLPGETLLKSLGEEFSKAPSISRGSSSQAGPVLPDLGGGSSSTQVKIARQCSLKEFLQLSNALNKFMKNKDQAGYKAWYQKLPGKGKLILHFNTLIQGESKGKEVDWNTQLATLSSKTGKSVDEMEKMRNEISAYRKVGANLQKILHDAVSRGLPAANASSLYPALAGLLENSDTVAAKTSALKMTLLQVTVPTAKEALNKNLTSLIQAAGKLYALPDAS